MSILSEPDFYPALLARTERFCSDLQAVFDRSPIPAQVQSVGAMFAVYLGTREPVADYADIRALDPNYDVEFLHPTHRPWGLLPHRLLGFGRPYR